jgi:U4/U6 small nuclear ribonucleoprotein PRP4
MHSDVSGTSGRAKRQWFLMDMSSQYMPSTFLQMGGLTTSSHISISLSSGFRYQVATGGADDTIRIWDIRALKSTTTIPAHRSNVADIRFFHSSSPLVSLDRDSMSNDSTLSEDQVYERYRSGLYFASAGYDGLVKIWSADDWQIVRSLTADADKVMSVDLSPDGTLLAAGSFSRNYQLFAAEGCSR